MLSSLEPVRGKEGGGHRGNSKMCFNIHNKGKKLRAHDVKKTTWATGRECLNP